MWMFRWLQRLFAHGAASGANHDPRWVEPSNAITRAILAGMVAEMPLAAKPAAGALPAVAAAPAASVAEHTTPEADDAAVERAPAQPATRTAQRTRRRRASRAA